MIVTGIEPVTKQKSRVLIDGQFAFVLYKGELSRYHIKEEKELSEEIYQEIMQEVLLKRAKLRAMHLLTKMDRTKAQLCRKLQENGYPQSIVDAAVAYVESFGYINDLEYARRYVEFQKKGKGQARLKMELAQKGIDRQIIQQVFEEDFFENNQEVILELIRKKRKNDGPMDEKEKQRIYAFLLRRGFSSSEILDILRKKDEF